MDTIFARATPPGRSGVAIIRVSGPSAFGVVEAFGAAPVAPRTPALRRLLWDGEVLDEALLLGFAAGASFTGEDVLEIQCHGSIAVVNAFLAALGALPNLRPAEAGEFTRRALMNGRLDLTQVEALADLIDAETEMQRRVAARGFEGGFSDRIAQWRQDLLRAAALIEATIDFADEEVPVDVIPEVLELLRKTMAGFEKAAAGVAFGERLREGFEVALVGAPNVGKSTLLNALAGRDAALTSEYAGTTRDVIEVRMDIKGLPVTLLDTAGVRDGQDPVEVAGIERTRARAEGADLRLFLGPVPKGLIPGDQDIHLVPKADEGSRGQGLPVSGRTGQGVDVLVDQIGTALLQRQPAETIATRSRHQAALRRALDDLHAAEARLLSDGGFPELAAEDMRKALRALDGLLGRVGVEDLLGEIFSSFCIGK